MMNQAAITRKRSELTRALCDAVFQTGEGWITSPATGAHTKLRLEVISGSTLPEKLAERGFRLARAGHSTRITPNALQTTIKDAKGNVVQRAVHPGEVQVDVYQVELP